MQNKLVDKLVDECTENIDEVKIAKVTLTKNMSKSQFLHAVHCIVFNSVYN